MYRLMLYLLIFLVLAALVLSFFKLLPFTPLALLLSTVVLIAICWLVNTIFARVFKAPTNFESVYITALILVLIITPVNKLEDLQNLFWVAVFAMASKYIFAISRKHLFNPAAFAVAVSAVALNAGASWWAGTVLMTPFVTIGGLLMVRKIKRVDLVFSFLFTALVVMLGSSLLKGNDLIVTVQKLILDTPLLFFAFVMLTEPQTTPPTKTLQILYGGLVGLLFAPFINIGNFYFTPEISLLVGNIFSYIVSPKEKLLLRLKEKLQVANDTYDFVFDLDKKFTYSPGQYMEWTLGHKNPDSRGNRRYFTLASSPTEQNLRIGVKFYPESGSFKKALISLDSTRQIVASQLSGEFTLPKDLNQKLCFIAGGIGITPYRSIIKYLIDTDQKRDIILLYSNKTASDIAYKDIFSEAFTKLGIKTIFILTDKESIPQGWGGKVGYIDSEMIQEEVPDTKERTFYISGPHSMADAFKKTLKGMGVSENQIKADYFPGYAG